MTEIRENTKKRAVLLSVGGAKTYRFIMNCAELRSLSEQYEFGDQLEQMPRDWFVGWTTNAYSEDC